MGIRSNSERERMVGVMTRTKPASVSAAAISCSKRGGSG